MAGAFSRSIPTIFQKAKTEAFLLNKKTREGEAVCALGRAEEIPSKTPDSRPIETCVSWADTLVRGAKTSWLLRSLRPLCLQVLQVVAASAP